MRNNRRSYTFSLILATLVVVILPLVTPLSAHAQGIPTYDNANFLQNIQDTIKNTISAAEQTLSTGQQFYEWAQTFALATLKAKLVGTLSGKIIGYVQGGGKPKYVTNWSTYLQGAQATGASNAASAVSNSHPCSSFNTQLLTNIGATGATPPANSPSTYNPITCSFPDGKLEAIAKDPRQGSWDDYLKMNQPQNNLPGAMLIAHDAQQNAVETSSKAAQSEAIAGGGFLSAKDKNGNITTPGSVFSNITSKAVTSPIDLVIGTNQLSGILGSIANLALTDITKSNDSGISGSSPAAQRTARNNTRTAAGNLITTSQTATDCSALFQQLYPDYPQHYAINPVTGLSVPVPGEYDLPVANYDVNGDGVVDSKDVVDLNGLDTNGDGIVDTTHGEGEQGLTDTCLANADAQNGNNSSQTATTIDEVLAKRQQADKSFATLAGTLGKTKNTLASYINNPVKKTLYKIDYPDYDPSNDPDGAQYAYVKNVYTHVCFTIVDYHNNGPSCPSGTPTDANGVANCVDTSLIKKAPAGSAVPLVHYIVADVAYIHTPFDAANSPTQNPGANAATIRCTVDSSIASTAPSPTLATDHDYTNDEAAYYANVQQAIQTVASANAQAVAILTKLKHLMTTAAKSTPATLRDQKVGYIVTDFECHGNPYVCAFPDPDPTHQGAVIQLPADVTDGGGDADLTNPQAGYFDASGNWQLLPNYSTLSQSTLGHTDTLSLIIQQLGLNIGTISTVAQNGLTTNIDNDPTNDPSNPYYVSDFDPDEAENVYQISQGDFTKLGSLLSPAEAQTLSNPSAQPPDQSSDSGSDSIDAGTTPE